ncbi:MAG: phosphate ABC transporter substrate-binding protein PstS [Candidatus Cloacimonetes bacterium]|nr:phosphate ABC transporter substrate-binding protein PstS [Candidatus Cloacimonadota bacterium]MCF7814032.1 phosphate ABC transporter substrate-binding protein PstS [Candidatus Cloacimonadota bacterium]MCF7868064.1 phosphate ABC transporter substrate-binding protein PstS [Candidatus Cloacimonadota bacterium]MCF7883487.1 phosphate ABC transporter substrate-binding protein PstS [Candidatus Cloacimonadota bacterium]
MKKILFIIVTVILIVIGCSNFEKDLSGAGATFPEPLYKKMFLEYEKATGQKIGYQGIGSGSGIFRLKEKSVDFAATDIIMEKADSENILYIPTSLGAVAVVYNLPAKPMLNLTSELLVKIFMGKITHWNDDEITTLNPDVVLPNQRILIINRADESGTSKIFNDYLCKVSTEWKNRKENPLKKFFAFSTRSNEEMASFIADMSGSIGFLSLSYAIENRMSFAKIQNSSGNFVLPSMVSVSVAAETEIPEDTKIYITNTNAEFGYPISSFTWIIVHRNPEYLDQEKIGKLKKLLNWMVSEGQAFAPALNYAPMPPETVFKAQKIIEMINN